MRDWLTRLLLALLHRLAPPPLPASLDARVRLELEGPHYLELLPRIHERLRPATYAEIGVANGDSLACARAGTRAVGIDPEPGIKVPINAAARIFNQTSDDFFAQHDLVAELGGRLELGFIDGLHLFENVLRDFAQLERAAAPGATILIHDCFPLDEASAARERATAYWTGDVWRALVALRRHRPDLEITLLDAPPSGLAVVRRLDPASRLLAERMPQIVAEALAMKFADIAPRKREQLGLVSCSDALFDRLMPR